MKLEIKTYLILLFAIICIGCSSDKDSNSEPLSSSKAITSFSISGMQGDINETNKSIALALPSGANIMALTPTINISQFAIVSPASGVSQDFTDPVNYTVTAQDESSTTYTASVSVEQCANAPNIHAFTYNGKNYEIIKENKTWQQAASCATERGGYLALINNVSENSAIFNEALNNASINLANTVAADGGNASYLWLGGNDIDQEDTWIWDGTNSGVGNQFWQGDASGSPIDGLYNNWGNEPDDYNNNQDALALGLTEWPLGNGSLGSAMQWNDVAISNTLYYVIEFD